MQRRLIAMMMPMTLLIGAASMGNAHAGDPVCREASVVDEMAREIRAVDHYTRLDSRLVTEQPTTDPNVVRCQVCVESAPYDTLRFGDRPIRRCIAHAFEVRIRPGGFIVQDLR